MGLCTWGQKKKLNGFYNKSEKSAAVCFLSRLAILGWPQCPYRILYCTVLYCTVLYSTVLYCTDCTVLYSTVLCSTVLYSTVLYSTVLYCAVQYSMVDYVLSRRTHSPVILSYLCSINSN